MQQRQGRVQPTKKQGKGFTVNDSPALENEADDMGKKAAAGKDANVNSNANESIQKQDDTGSQGNPFNYIEMRTLNWSWNLIDQDINDGYDLASQLDMEVHMGKIPWGDSFAWVINRVNFNPQARTGLSVVPVLKSHYSVVSGKLHVSLDVQCAFFTGDREVSTSTSFGAELSASQKTSIGASAPVKGVDVEAGVESGRSASLSFTKSWSEKATLPGSRTSFTNTYIFRNGPSSMSVSKSEMPLATELIDLDLDDGQFWAIDGSEWKVNCNDSGLTGGLSY